MSEPSEPEEVGVDLRPPVRENWVQRRRRKIREEIERNRRGEAAIPTWVLAALLVVIVVGWVLFVVVLG
jgi:hypothetical protein